MATLDEEIDPSLKYLDRALYKGGVNEKFKCNKNIKNK